MSDASFHPIQLTLPSLTPSLVLEVLPYGLTLHRLYVQSRGQTHDILIGPEAPSDHSSQKYVNTIVGRYANRLPVPSDNQGIVVEKNGVQSTVYPRANERETVSLHGGVTGWDSVPWTPLFDPSQIQLFTPAELETIGAELQPPSAVVFTRTSEDGEEGFPGRVRVEVLVALVPPKGNQVEKEETNLGAVVLLYRAKLEEEGKVTPINLTQVRPSSHSSLLYSLSIHSHLMDVALGIQPRRIPHLHTLHQRPQAHHPRRPYPRIGPYLPRHRKTCACGGDAP